MKDNVEEGYDQKFCIKCENMDGITQEFSSFTVKQKAKCKTTTPIDVKQSSTIPINSDHALISYDSRDVGIKVIGKQKGTNDATNFLKLSITPSSTCKFSSDRLKIF